MATHSRILAWRTPWTEQPGGPRATGSQSQTRLSTYTGESAAVSAPGRATSPGRNSPELISWTQSPEARSGGGVGPPQRAWLSPGASRALRAEGRAWLLSPWGPGALGLMGASTAEAVTAQTLSLTARPRKGLSACVPGGGLLTPAPGTVRPRCPALGSGSANALPGGLDVAGQPRGQLGARLPLGPSPARL